MNLNRECNTKISRETVISAISNLKKRKAADPSGIAAEHLKLLPNKAIDILVHTLQKISEGTVPNSLKETYKVMIPKLDKDHRMMDNCRSIRIASRSWNSYALNMNWKRWWTINSQTCRSALQITGHHHLLVCSLLKPWQKQRNPRVP